MERKGKRCRKSEERREKGRCLRRKAVVAPPTHTPPHLNYLFAPTRSWILVLCTKRDGGARLGP